MSNVDTKEIQKYQNYVEKIGKYSSSLEVKSDEDYKSALAEGKAIKDKLTEITGRKEEITKPMNAALKSVRDLFKPIETAGEVALRTIKDKMISFSEAQRKAAEKEKERLAARVEKGTMKVETAVKKMDDIKEPEKTVRTGEGKATNVVRRKVRFADLGSLKAENLYHLISVGCVVWNESVARKAALDGLVTVGVEIYEETDLNLG